MSGSGRPESQQVKKIGTDASQMTHGYWTQQGDIPPPGATTQHPLAPVKIVSSEQQQLTDAAGA